LNASLCLRRMSLGFVTRSPSMMCICWLRAHLQAGHESTDRAHCRTEGQCGLQTTLTFKATFMNLVALREFVQRIRPYAVEIDSLEAVAFAPNVGAPSWTVEGRYVVRD
jgi:hypothetical protein